MSSQNEKLLKIAAGMTDAQVRVAFVQLISSEKSISHEECEKLLSKGISTYGGSASSPLFGSTI